MEFAPVTDPQVGLSPDAMSTLHGVAAPFEPVGWSEAGELPTSALASLAAVPAGLLPSWDWLIAEPGDPTPVYDELITTMPDPSGTPFEEVFEVGWQILPVRNSPADPVADDYLVWSSVTEAPWFRGGRERVIAVWRSNAPNEISDERFDQLFESADAFGTSARGLGDHWGDRIMCMEVPGGPGLLPRERLREFADAVFPGGKWAPDAERVAALLEPFETEDDHE